MNRSQLRKFLLIAPPICSAAISWLSIAISAALLFVYFGGWICWIAIRPEERARLRAPIYWRQFCQSHPATRGRLSRMEECSGVGTIDGHPYSLVVRVSPSGIEIKNRFSAVGPAFVEWSEISMIEVAENAWIDEQSRSTATLARLLPKEAKWNSIFLVWTSKFDDFVPPGVGLVRRTVAV